MAGERPIWAGNPLPLFGIDKPRELRQRINELRVDGEALGGQSGGI
jgi:hypothetical protein